MKLGFTGTIYGLSKLQHKQFMNYIKRHNIDEFHHGDCVGADAHAHAMVSIFKSRTHIYIHPAKNMGKKRAHCPRAFLTYEPINPLERNRDIVDACDMIIACPRTTKELLRSGTWATIRYARKINKPIMIIYSD